MNDLPSHSGLFKTKIQLRQSTCVYRRECIHAQTYSYICMHASAYKHILIFPRHIHTHTRHTGTCTCTYKICTQCTFISDCHTATQPRSPPPVCKSMHHPMHPDAPNAQTLAIYIRIMAYDISYTYVYALNYVRSGLVSHEAVQ